MSEDCLIWTKKQLWKRIEEKNRIGKVVELKKKQDETQN